MGTIIGVGISRLRLIVMVIMGIWIVTLDVKGPVLLKLLA